MSSQKRYTVMGRQKLIDAYRSQGWNHKEFSKACGVSRQYMYRVLNGEPLTRFRATVISHKLINKWEISRKYFRIYQPQKGWVHVPRFPPAKSREG